MLLYLQKLHNILDINYIKMVRYTITVLQSILDTARHRYKYSRTSAVMTCAHASG